MGTVAHECNSRYLEVEVEGVQSKVTLAKEENTKGLECCLSCMQCSKQQALSSNPRTAEKQNKTKNLMPFEKEEKQRKMNGGWS
jgi:hypothetical protein